MLKKILFAIFLAISIQNEIDVESICSICTCDGKLVNCFQKLKSKTLTKALFQTIPVATEDLNLRFNGIKTLPIGIFDHLVNLKHIDLSFNNLKTLNSQIFHKLTKLKSLDISTNLLISLPNGVFQSQKHLEHLFLSLNKLVYTNIASEVFSPLESVNTLDLAGNPLLELPSSIAKMKKLQLLSAYNMKLRKVEKNFFDNMPEINHIEFAENHITHWPDGIFQKTKKVNKLGLAMNFLEAVPKNLNSLPLLSQVTLAENAGFICMNQHLKDSVGKDIDECSSEVDNTKIVKIGTLKNPEHISNLDHNAKTLVLKNNGYTHLPSGIFDSFTQLQILDLSFNKLSTLPAKIFDKLHKLKHLILAYNQLQTLPANIFSKLTQLNELNLGGNKLTIAGISSASTVFHNLHNLKMLQIEFNNFQTLPKKLV